MFIHDNTIISVLYIAYQFLTFQVFFKESNKRVNVIRIDTVQTEQMRRRLIESKSHRYDILFFYRNTVISNSLDSRLYFILEILIFITCNRQ